MATEIYGGCDHISTDGIGQVSQFIEINEHTIELIKKQKGGDNTKVINLVKSIEKIAEEHSNDPFLIAMAERAKAVQETFEDRQISTKEALDALLNEVQKNEERKREQAERGFDGLTFFVYRTLLDAGLIEPEAVSRKIKIAFTSHPNWLNSDKEQRELRKRVTFALCAVEADLDKVAEIVNELFTLLTKAYQMK